KGRSEYIQLSHLDECWLHITNNCNLKCSHCLFSCSSEKTETLSYDDIKRSVDETYQAGAKIFYLTGGEPFVHKNIEKILSMILLDYKDTSLVVMTNGINIPKHISFLQTLPKDRLYFQVSADGTYEKHDQTRGKGAFQALLKGLTSLKELNTRNTLAMAVHSENIFQMKDLIDIAKTYKMHAVHYLWLMVTGSAKSNLFVDPNIIFSNLIDASIYAKEKEIEIDNIRNMSFQVFSPAG
ncbi:methyltransferase type 11, partial [Candidatus Magnetomorum sp. HK-1]